MMDLVFARGDDVHRGSWKDYPVFAEANLPGVHRTEPVPDDSSGAHFAVSLFCEAESSGLPQKATRAGQAEAATGAREAEGRRAF